MSDSRFNIEAVREVNQLKIFSNNGSSTEKIFWAYLPSGFSVNTALNTDSWLGGIQESLQNNLGGFIRMANAFGLTSITGVDIRRYMFYSGTKPLTFDVHSFLILRNDYDTDILQPLQKLMNFYLPKRGSLASLDNIIKKSLKNSEDTWKNNNTAVGGYAAKVFDLLSQGYQALKDFIGPVYTTQMPQQFAKTETSQVNNTVFFGKHFYFEDCFITSVNLNIPVFLVEGGRPDVIDVSLRIETARNATADMFNFNKKIDLGSDAGWQWI